VKGNFEKEERRGKANEKISLLLLYDFQREKSTIGMGK